MTKKELILDCLIEDDEAFTQIVEFFKYVKVDISKNELEKTLCEMVTDGYIVVNKNWCNEHNEYPYSLTEKGLATWKNIKE